MSGIFIDDEALYNYGYGTITVREASGNRAKLSGESKRSKEERFQVIWWYGTIPPSYVSTGHPPHESTKQPSPLAARPSLAFQTTGSTYNIAHRLTTKPLRHGYRGWVDQPDEPQQHNLHYQYGMPSPWRCLLPFGCEVCPSTVAMPARFLRRRNALVASTVGIARLHSPGVTRISLVNLR